MRLSVVVGLLLIGFGLGAAAATFTGDARLRRVQQYADSVTVAAVAKDSALRVSSAVTTQAVAQLARSERNNRIAASNDSLKNERTDELLTLAQTAADSNQLRGEQIVTLKHEVLSLNQALANADAQVIKEHDGRMIAEDRVHDLTDQLVSLNIKIKQLQPRTPQWLRTAGKVAELGGAFLLGRASR